MTRGELSAGPRSVGGDVDIAAVGALVADPARCRILLALADGRALPANRLAADAGVSAATASSHLGKLTDAGMLVVEARGRYRFYRLAGPEVSDLIEALERLAPAVPVQSLRQSHRARALRDARMCYDHIAGRLGVELMRVLVERGHLAGDDDYLVTQEGTAFLGELGVPCPARGRPIRYHQDSSEQRPHISGALGRDLADRLFELGWLRRSEDSRALTVTRSGREGFEATFGIRLDG